MTLALARRLVLAGLLVAGAPLRAQDDSWLAALSPAHELAADLREEIVQIPLRGATREETAFPLTGTLYQPPGAGPFPVVVLSHGSPGRARDRDRMGRYRLIPQVRALVDRGLAVLVPMRRGYGASPGDFVESFGGCGPATDFERAGREAARDVLSALDHVRTRPTLDAQRVVLMGQSAGGFASLAAAGQAPAGVVAVVNLAGGRGGNGRDGQPCAPERMAQTLARYAAGMRAPALWFYAENDRYFGPDAVRGWYRAFEAAGGRGRLVVHPPHGEDGHLLFYRAAAIPVWLSAMADFFESQGLHQLMRP